MTVNGRDSMFYFCPTPEMAAKEQHLRRGIYITFFPLWQRQWTKMTFFWWHCTIYQIFPHMPYTPTSSIKMQFLAHGVVISWYCDAHCAGSLKNHLSQVTLHLSFVHLEGVTIRSHSSSLPRLSAFTTITWCLKSLKALCPYPDNLSRISPPPCTWCSHLH